MRNRAILRGLSLCGAIALVTVGCAGSPEQSAGGEGGYSVGGVGSSSGAAVSSYTVVQGDNLWEIAAMASIYGNAYRWPLIYRDNQGQIEDADLILPGQRLTIGRNHSPAEIAAAEAHARSRGPWAVGVVEQSDRDYLGR